MKNRSIFHGKLRPLVSLVAGGVAAFAVGGAIAGFNIVIHDGDDDYQVCQVTAISRDMTVDGSGALEVELDPSTSEEQKRCETYFGSQKAEGDVTFILPNGDNVGCGFTYFRIEADGTVIGQVEDGCFGGAEVSIRQTNSYECFIDDETNRAYVLNVGGLANGFDCDPSLPDVVFVGNAIVGNEDAGDVVTFQAKNSVRIMPPFEVLRGNTMRAFTSGS